MGNAASNEDDVLEGFNETVPSSGRNYILAGRGRVRIVRCKRKLASEAYSGKDTFIAELTTVSHTPAEEGGERMQPGDTRSYVVVYDKRYPKMYHSDIKKFIAAADGSPPEAITVDQLKFAISAENPLEGVEMDFFAKTSKTEKGGEFTKIEFKAVPEQAAAA